VTRGAGARARILTAPLAAPSSGAVLLATAAVVAVAACLRQSTCRNVSLGPATASQFLTCHTYPHVPLLPTCSAEAIRFSAGMTAFDWAKIGYFKLEEVASGIDYVYRRA
jgi:apolipoprotein N-acyltransferase